VSAEPVTDIDTTAAEALSKLDDDLERVGVELCFAEMKGPAKDSLKRYGLFSKLGDHLFFRTIDEAVEAYQKAAAAEKSTRSAEA
jgi:MFS superfamily sulfate permease-like transporter